MDTRINKQFPNEWSVIFLLCQQCPVSGECHLKHVDTFSSVALLSSDWAFCYGSYGYGESYQVSG